MDMWCCEGLGYLERKGTRGDDVSPLRMLEGLLLQHRRFLVPGLYWTEQVGRCLGCRRYLCWLDLCAGDVRNGDV
ncbi:hypothetical protein PR048_011766 [Dryococelus australis]|uniref:MHC class I antigen n=1 Tax=Dryococelus australis TaxID=614101 RepID=A0ABQ9HMK0_9NEOP|nr:hypothetical protein PR048_011766 [Dryococelus australis]